MLFQSIRIRIVLWYMLILAVTLLLLGLALYHNFSHKLKRDMDDLLRSRAYGIAESIDTYWEAERLRTGRDIPAAAFNKDDNINFLKIARRWVNEKTSHPALINSFVQIFDPYGNSITSSMRTNRPLPQRVLRGIRDGSSYAGESTMEVQPGKVIVLRTYAIPIIDNNRLAYIVQVASPLSDMTQALHNLSLMLLLFLPLTVVLTGIAGLFLARIALNPVHRMIEATHKITAANLALRLDVPRSRDEIHFLAVTLNQMLGRLDESFKSQRQLTENISHELKTPLAVLKGELGVALKKERQAAEYKATLRSSQEEVDNLIRIVEDVLMLARFDDQTDLRRADPVHVNQVVKSVFEDARVLADQKNIALDVIEQPDLMVRVDPRQFCRLLLNLLDNAIKYTPSGGRVGVRLYKDMSMVKVEVTDTGIGIPPEDVPHIFDRFYRADKARARTGFGLGLSIARSIAHAYHGTLEVKSVLHQGSTFTASFPRAN